MRRKTFIILALVLVFALIFTACAVRRPLQTPTQTGPNTTEYYNNRATGTTTGTGTNTGLGTTTGTGTYTGMGTSPNNPYDVGYYGYNNDMYGGYGTNYRNIGGTNNYSNFGLNNTGTATTDADRLARTCERVPGVTNATVVVSGNTAYVGVDTNGTPAGNNISYGRTNDISTVKRQCAQQIKSTNPQIQTVYVSTDANFFDRLRNVGNGVRNGSAVDSFRNELDGLVRSLTPERL